jgi:glycosyltransferase involved in cell wall biosynthesis
MHSREALLIDVIIPALNEEDALPHVLREIPRVLPAPWSMRHIVVANNGSTDRTAEVAREEGAIVIDAPRRGYGSACLAAMASMMAEPPDVVVFLDGDHSDRASELPRLLRPMERGAELVIGSRTRGRRERGSLTPQQRVGNAIATRALRLFYGANFTDLGPFRAITWDALMRLSMVDLDYGWTVEMQIKGAKQRLRMEEVPVSYRKRIGVSKVSGTLRGTIGASHKIISLLLRHR